MINTILFDLDGTLVSMDTEVFTERYFIELSIKLKDYFTLDELRKTLWSSIKYMMQNSEVNKTNEEAFFEYFYKNIEYSQETMKPLLEEFYEVDFDKIKDVSEKNDHIVRAVEILKKKNYDLIVATNPMFPRSAVTDRIKWAGLDEEDFKFITSFECMHFCKPSLGFYKEVLSHTGKQASKCMMVGNDIDEDMIAKELGIGTYLVKNFIKGDIEKDKNVDHSGYYEDFYEFVKELSKI